MSKKHPPLVMPDLEAIKPNRPIPQDSLDLFKLPDIIHLRNTYIRSRNESLKELGIAYNKRIQHLSDKYFSSPQQIEKIITDNANK